MNMRHIGNGMAIPDPPLKRIRVRGVVTDTSSPIEPRLKYVYSDAKTQDDQEARFINVHWADGGMSRIPNDENVTWLIENKEQP